jgi:hypothetical protein
MPKKKTCLHPTNGSPLVSAALLSNLAALKTLTTRTASESANLEKVMTTIKRQPKLLNDGCYYHIETSMLGKKTHTVAVTNWGRLKYAGIFAGWDFIEIDRKRLAKTLLAARKEMIESAKLAN